MLYPITKLINTKLYYKLSPESALCLLRNTFALWISCWIVKSSGSDTCSILHDKGIRFELVFFNHLNQNVNRLVIKGNDNKFKRYEQFIKTIIDPFIHLCQIHIWVIEFNRITYNDYLHIPGIHFSFVYFIFFIYLFLYVFCSLVFFYYYAVTHPIVNIRSNSERIPLYFFFLLYWILLSYS